MIYLDNNASTPLAPEAWRAMETASGLYGNPSSVHAVGQSARRRLEEARDEVAALVGARSEEIVWTSGGTEANALAIFGACAGRSGRIVTSAVEHPSVRACADRLAENGGFELIAIAPERTGELDPDRVLDAVTPGTVLVSIMAANNEYGGVFPIARIAREARRRGSLVHTDAVQAAGRIPVDADEWGVDLLSLSAHKLHGPKGAGALYVRRGVPLAAHTPGGGQEKRRRAGTENTLAAVGFGAAARLAARAPEADAPAVRALRDRLEAGVLARIPGTRIVGAESPRLPNTSAVLFEDASGETLLLRLDLEGVAVSVGSACSSGTLAPSPAILALGLSPREARGVVRFSLSRATTEEEIARVLEILPGVVEDVRRAGLVPATERTR
ncbi:MAG TPA: cysteine desulfurase family protein [Thermoanaerobaculia bacterium]|jgi:cysteine desulfurase